MLLPHELAAIASRIDRAALSVMIIGRTLDEAGHPGYGAKADELSVELLYLRRELLELPKKTGVAPLFEDPQDASGDDVPF